MISDNVKNIEKRIREAEEKSPFHQKVKLVGVSKFREIGELEQLVGAGVSTLGENRVQELTAKYPHFEGRVKWHLIGTLQKNKVKYIIDKVELIHSLDSVSLAEEIQKQAAKHDILSHVLLQVNVAKEESKHGFTVEELESAIREISEMPNIRVDGMMVIAPDIPNRDELRAIFEKSRKIYDNLVKTTEKYDNINIKILSMGMTNDFELAIACGANMVRIGRALFN